ncbi:MAG: hypothetical protein U0360_05905 [Dehalococcoidia bacterium]
MGCSVAVRVVVRETGETVVGKFAAIDRDVVGLFSGIMAGKNGAFRGCGRKRTFVASEVSVDADDPATETRTR